MELERFEDPVRFLDSSRAFLEAREAEHNLLIGLAQDLASGRRFGPGAPKPYLARVQHEGETVAVALRTPPHNLVLSQVDDPAAYELLAADAMRGSRPDGVFASPMVATLFESAWRRLTGEQLRVQRNERIFRLTSVRDLPETPGTARRLRESDRAVVVPWLSGFIEETGGMLDTGEAVFDRTVGAPPETRGMWLWEDEAGQPVSAVGYQRPTRRGIGIAPVYTPAEARGRGYATALVAHVCRDLLASGREFVVLFADYANPTANHVYERVGFQSILDMSEYAIIPGWAY